MKGVPVEIEEGLRIRQLIMNGTVDNVLYVDSNKKLANQTYATLAGNLDHGNLLGLGDDDHTQYLLNTGDTGTGDYGFNGAVTINEAGADKDFRVEASGVPNAFWVDGTNGYVGINDYDNSPPLAQLHLKSNLGTMQLFEQVADGVIYGFGSQGGYLRFKYFGSLLGGSDKEFMRMGINVDINQGRKNIDFKYSGDTTANIFVLDAGLEEVKTL
ncbi:MAG TPA: hypothetical protein ENH35_05750, partial [Candidatus Moranbacteria bacterium]|nr:hypothetical protein [Candidatus Moranbacteria bacterium]